MQTSFSALRPIVTGKCCNRTMDFSVPRTTETHGKESGGGSGKETSIDGRAMGHLDTGDNLTADTLEPGCKHSRQPLFNSDAQRVAKAAGHGSTERFSGEARTGSRGVAALHLAQLQNSEPHTRSVLICRPASRIQGPTGSERFPIQSAFFGMNPLQRCQPYWWSTTL